jgi:hypothetical protein
MPEPTVAETAPDTQSQNPFELVAYLLFKVRHSLEDVERANRPPRWVRVARAREAKAEVIGGGIATITHGFATGVSFMAELVLDLREILVQTDAGKALLEVSLDEGAPRLLRVRHDAIDRDLRRRHIFRRRSIGFGRHGFATLDGVACACIVAQQGRQSTPESCLLHRLGHAAALSRSRCISSWASIM